MADKDFNNNYIKVKQRILQLKKDGLWNNVSVQTEVVKIDTQLDVTGKQKLFAIVKANVQIGTQFFTAHAMETQGIGEVNYLHFLENAETSAVGRALSFAGIAEEGVAIEDSNVATKEDIETAKEQVKDINAEKRKEIAKALIEKTLTIKQPTIAPKVEVKFDESNIPVFSEIGNFSIRPKEERDKIIAWLKKVNKFDEINLVGALIRSEMSIKYKTFNALISKGSYNDILTTFKHL
jgi:hypothetical protein